MAADNWAADGPISRPQPPHAETPVVVDFGGFGFGAGGMSFNLSEADADEMFTPTYAPGQ